MQYMHNMPLVGAHLVAFKARGAWDANLHDPNTVQVVGDAPVAWENDILTTKKGVEFITVYRRTPAAVQMLLGTTFLVAVHHERAGEQASRWQIYRLVEVQAMNAIPAPDIGLYCKILRDL